MLNTIRFDPGQRSLFLTPVSSANTTERRPLLAGCMDQLVKIHRHCWKGCLNINEAAKFERDMLKISKVQCRSEISEPKYARKTRMIRVFVYSHTSIDISAYASLVCMSLPIVFFFCGKVIVDFNGHCICSENWWSRLHRMSVDRLVFIPAVCFTIHCSRRRVLKKVQNFSLQKNQINVIGA